MAVTRKLYESKLSIKTVYVLARVSATKAGLGLLMGVGLVFCQINGEISSLHYYVQGLTPRPHVLPHRLTSSLVSRDSRGIL